MDQRGVFCPKCLTTPPVYGFSVLKVPRTFWRLYEGKLTLGKLSIVTEIFR